MFTEQEARSLLKMVLSYSKADEVFVTLSGGTTSHLRFSINRPDTSGSVKNMTASIESTFGTRSGASSTNQFDDDSLKKTVAMSEDLARLAPEDPEHLSGLGPQEYPRVQAYDEATAKSGFQFFADGAKECIRRANDQSLVAAGFIQMQSGFDAIGNSHGLFGYHTSTRLSFSETVRTADGGGSGWVSAAGNRWEDIDFARLSEIAVAKAKASVNPRRLEPGAYVTILEPSCVADLVRNLTFSMNARSADEGRSFFSKPGRGNRIGEQVFPENVTITSDPTDATAPGNPWGEDGLPQRRVEWISSGVVKQLSTSRWWAQKQKTSPLPGPANVIMKGGTGSLEDLIKSTEKGILVTSLWYIRGVDPRTMLLTGLTRDGVFMIENGKIAYPVTNFRWNDSPVSVLKNIVAMSKSVRATPRESRSGNVVVPALKLKEFHFSSVSDAV